MEKLSAQSYIYVGVLVTLVSLFFVIGGRSELSLFLAFGVIFLIIGVRKIVVKPKKPPRPVYGIKHCKACQNPMYDNYNYCPFCGEKNV